VGTQARKSTVLLANEEIGEASVCFSGSGARNASREAAKNGAPKAELFAARLHQLRRARGGNWVQCEDAQQKLVGVIGSLEGDAARRSDTSGRKRTARNIGNVARVAERL
jgi:hypothetical protein